ncbi:hypothetical protein [Rhodopirellula sallentina]|nr:hypothetical protein [Rhodopirellula sallentina]
MTCTTTMEYRVFSPDAFSNLRDWMDREETRTDYYASIASNRSSVKIRGSNGDARLETKHLVSVHDEMQIWTKLSCPVAEAECDATVRAARENWIAVTKRRSLRYFDSNGLRIEPDEIDEEGNDEIHDPPTQAEAAEVVVAGQTFFTFALERQIKIPTNSNNSRHQHAYREATDSLRLILRHAGFTSATIPPNESYPEWLRRRTIESCQTADEPA